MKLLRKKHKLHIRHRRSIPITNIFIERTISCLNAEA
jgi:hypothetical protein